MDEDVRTSTVRAALVRQPTPLGLLLRAVGISFAVADRRLAEHDGAQFQLHTSHLVRALVGNARLPPDAREILLDWADGRQTRLEALRRLGDAYAACASLENQLAIRPPHQSRAQAIWRALRRVTERRRAAP